MDIIYVPILLLFYLLFIFEFGVVTKTYLILVWTSGRRKYQGEVYPLKDQLMWLVWCRIIQDKTNYLQIMIELWSSSPALKGNFIQTLILSFLIKSNKLITKHIICSFCLVPAIGWMKEVILLRLLELGWINFGIILIRYNQITTKYGSNILLSVFNNVMMVHICRLHIRWYNKYTQDSHAGKRCPCIHNYIYMIEIWWPSCT